MADISVSMGLNNTQFNTALNQSQQQVTQFATLTQQQLNQLNGHFEKLKGIIAGLGFANIIKEAANLSSEIVKVGNATGLSTATVKGWSDALVAAGGEADNTRDALLDLNNKISESIQGGGSLLTAFNKVGVSLSDLRSKSQEDILTQVVQGLSDVKDGATRTSLAMQLMGEDVKTVDFRQVNDQLGEFTNRAKQYAPALEDAKKAQDEFNKTYNKFLEQVTVSIPWGDLTAGLKSIGDNLGQIVTLIKVFAELGATFLFLTRVLLPLEAIIVHAALSTAGFAAAIATLSGIVSSVITWFAEFRNLLLLMGPALVGVTGGIQTLTIGLGALIAIASRIGIVIGALYALNEASSLFSDNGNTIYDWAQNQAKALGLIDETSKEEDARKARMKAASEDALKSMDAENEGRKRQSDFLNQSIKSMNDLVSAYREQNNQILRGIENETALIGLGDEQQKVQTTLNQLKDAHIAKQDELNKKISEGGDPSILSSYQSALEQVNTAYNEQRVAIEAALQVQIQKERADRASTFAQNELYSALDRINNLNHEASNLFLPLVEQKYKDIEFAANAAAEAELRAEANRRGVGVDQLPGDYVSKIKDAANAKVKAEKEATANNEHAVELKNLELFKTDEIKQSANDLHDIYDKMATATMPTLARQQEEIRQAALKRAKSEIDAEEARRGSKLSADEAKQYYDTSIEGARGLIEATKASYDQSRSWSTGWAKAMNQYVESATDGASKAESIFQKAFSGMEDLLVNFAKTGKFEWKNFLSSLVEELLRTQIQAIFAGIIGDMTDALKGSSTGSGAGLLGSIFGGGSKGGIFGSIGDLLGLGGGSDKGSSKKDGGFLSGITDIFSGGGILGSIGDFFGGIGDAIGGIFDFGGGGILSGIADFFGGLFANGGNLGAGKWGIAGENGPEVISGPATITPMSQLGQNSGTNVTYNINAVDALSFKQMIASDPSFIYGVTLQGAKKIARR